MSTTRKIRDLVPFIAPEGQALFEDLRKELAPYIPEYQWEKLQQAVGLGEDKDRLLEILDDLQMATASFINPNLDRYHTFKHDLMRYFDLCQRFIEMDRPDGLNMLLAYYREVFREPKKICGHIRTTCTNKECDGKFKSIDQLICEKCDTPRTICHVPPASFGRCIGSHGKTNLINTVFRDGAVPGRAKIYGRNLQGELRDMYIEAMTDPEFLSVQPEIAALATRSGQLMKDLGDTDYLSVATGIRQAIRKMHKAASEEDTLVMLLASREIEDQLTAVADDKRRWDEIASISGRLGRLSETERKRIIEAQKVITVQEMYVLQQESLASIRDAIAIMATKVHILMENGSQISQPKLKRYMLSVLHGVIQGDINTDKLLMADGPIIEEDAEPVGT